MATVNKKEIWKDIPNYEGFYQASNLGRIKSLSRLKWNGKVYAKYKEIILKQSKDGPGYLTVMLCKHSNIKRYKTHQLVAMAFLGHKPNGYKLVINHINHNKLDNIVENLEIVTQRENANKKHIKSTSKYLGVSRCRQTNKWRACIREGNKVIHIGRYTDELDAHLAYQIKLKQLQYVYS